MQDIREWNGKAYIDVTRVRRPFLSYTGRGAFFLFGKAKRKNGGRITQVATFEQQNLPNKAKAECLTTLPACCY
jgi:hypothetical protein